MIKIYDFRFSSGREAVRLPHSLRSPGAIWLLQHSLVDSDYLVLSVRTVTIKCDYICRHFVTTQGRDC